MEFNKLIGQIIEYLDGELPVTKEQELFLALANNEGLRNIMREYLTISRTIHYDAVSFQPPPTATMNILKSLGFQNTEYISSPQKNTKSFLSKAKKLVLPALLMLVASFGTFLGTYHYLSVSQRNLSTSRAIVQTPPFVVTVVQNENQSYSAKSNSIFTSAPKGSKYENMNPKNSSIVQNNITEQIRHLMETSDSKVNSLQQNSINQDYSHYELNKINLNQSGEYPTLSSSKPKSIFFTVRGILGKSFPDPEIASKGTDKFFSNLSAGLYFTQWDNIKFGIEFGNEIFGLNYLNVKDGIEFTYEQKPNIYWAAVGIDYTVPKEIMEFPNIYPFVTMLAGGSQIGGPLLKGMLGLRYRLYNSNFEMYVATEGTLLFYQNQKKNFLSRKFGVTYGLSIIF